ncbi:CehA/McbA family metallohydrolase domain-containing protein [Actinomadura harenae]|uniref:Histidinol-phosphatase n=1 Tax=Actinomadura harenae TaxID=2483351 RepID=A0A3M2MCJ3_9ACTN|nr:histidinol-phosphatase [Actinomadura harenae]RMI47249.1 histidinol-phosphatase [Actinomadura harenae]
MGHHHHHQHHHDAPYADEAVPDTELRPGDLARRRFLQRLGLVGAAATGVGMLATPASAGQGHRPHTPDPRRLRWLAGDHHVHTQSSYDAMHTVAQQVTAGRGNGLDWMVITDHGHVAHEKFAVEQTYADVLKARRANPRMLLWQGLEWNVPSGEHATVFFDAARDELAALRAFEKLFDGNINGTNHTSPENEATALAGLRWMSGQIDRGVIDSALMIANHPSRNGRYSPHEFRNYRDTAPHIAVGMEGSPGAQNDGGHRGGYGNAPGTDSWNGWPSESYRTFGGFDWMTARLGGLWDAMLAEGRGWWITSNSDIHSANGSTLTSPTVPDGWYDAHGRYPDPVDTGVPQRYADFWPGQFSRTVVGAATHDFRGVMDAIRQGRVWVAMGGLLDDLDVQVHGEGGGHPATLGGRVTVRRGANVTVRITARLATRPNAVGDIPRLARLDLIRGAVTGRAADRDGFTNPQVSVVESFTPRRHETVLRVEHRFRNVREPFYLRLRGTDGKRSNGLEPMMDVQGAAAPWDDLWCYANPVFVDVR